MLVSKRRDLGGVDMVHVIIPQVDGIEVDILGPLLD